MEQLKKFRFDIVSMALLTLFPVFIWSTMEPISDRFGSVFATMTSLGQLTALVGTTLVALSMIFQIRLNSWFCKLLSRPTTCTNFHHYMGVYGLLLLILHPLFLAARFVSQSLEVSAKFIYTTDTTNLIGLIALVLMIVSMYTTLFLARKFRFWKLFHQLMLIAYLGILYHLTFISSDMSENVLLKVYLLGLLTLGGISFGYQKISCYLKPKVGCENDGAI